MKTTKVIGITNQKGGVGKSTTTAAMGAVLIKRGFSVLLIDDDDTGNPSLSKNLGGSDETNQITLTDLLHDRISIKSGLSKREPISINDSLQKHQEGFDFIAADNALPGITANVFSQLDDMDKMSVLRDLILEIKDKCNYDYILIDAAPALNIMSTNLLNAVDEIIISTESSDSAEDGIEELIKTAEKIKANLNPKLEISGILVTKVDSRTNNDKEVYKAIKEKYNSKGIKVFNTFIPHAVSVKECTKYKKTILEYDPSGKAAHAYIDFVNEYLSPVEYPELKEEILSEGNLK